MGPLVHKGVKGPQDLLAHKVFKVFKVFLGMTEAMEAPDLLALKESRDSKVFLGHSDLLAP